MVLDRISPPEAVARHTANRETAGKIDEEKLIERIRAGEEEARGDLVRAYQNILLKEAKLLCIKNPINPEDIVHDTFMKAIRNIEGFRGESSLRGWLRAILLNNFRSRLRKNKARKGNREREYDDSRVEFESLSPEDAAISTQTLEKISEIVEKLSPIHQEVLRLRAEGFSYEEIAGKLKISKGTVMSRLFHARKNLKEKLRKAGFSDLVKGLKT